MFSRVFFGKNAGNLSRFPYSAGDKEGQKAEFCRRSATASVCRLLICAGCQFERQFTLGRERVEREAENLVDLGEEFIVGPIGYRPTSCFFLLLLLLLQSLSSSSSFPHFYLPQTPKPIHFLKAYDNSYSKMN